MVDVFDEVEEELRKERYQTLLRQYGPWVGGVAVAVVVGVAGYEGWKAWRTNEAAQASDRYVQALDALADGDDEAADARLAELAADGPRGYGALATMQRAALALEAGETSQAARLYEEAAQRSPDPMLRDLATYQAVLSDFDALSFDDIALRLEPVADSGGALALLARELMAAAAVKDERWDEARGRYDTLSFALDTPPGMQRRVLEALAFIQQNAPAPADAPLEADPIEAELEQAAGEPEAAPQDDEGDDASSQTPEEDGA
ncbi:MAG: tetratricopeptide repeat protein [Pseudomonadota bacterium]